MQQPAETAAPPAHDALGAERFVRGVSAAPGVAIGPAYVYQRDLVDVKRETISPDAVPDEHKRFDQAVRRAERDLVKVAALARDKLGEDSAAIFEAQAMIMRDAPVYQAIRCAIADHHVDAAYAAKVILSRLRKKMETSPSEAFRDRASDFDDVQDRLLRHLKRGQFLSTITPETVVLSDGLSAADVLLFSRRGILGCAMDFGGATSHVSIIARSLGVPLVVSTHDIAERATHGEMVIVDGMDGVVILSPTDRTLAHYRRRQERYDRHREEGRGLTALASETSEGVAVALRANVELLEELPQLAEYGAEGIGLFRTEIVYLMRGRLDVEEQKQEALYREVVRAAAPHPTTFRVLDLGGDKVLPLAHREHNPFLGWRGIRILLDKAEELLMPQLRAMLRASEEGPVCLLVPMITDLSEVLAVKDYLARARRDVEAEGVSLPEHVPFGIMVEVPAVALMARQFAPHVDFFSIGTNDLTQYTLAVDRGNDLVAGLFDALHPSVLYLIAETVRAAREAGIGVSVCGQLAADPSGALMLIGLGVRDLSASPTYLPEIKRVVRATSLAGAEALAEEALRAPSAAHVRTLAADWLREHGCGLDFALTSEPPSFIPPHLAGEAVVSYD